MGEVNAERSALAEYLSSRRTAILVAWHAAVKRDPALSTGESLPGPQLFDHIPAMLSTFERQVRGASTVDSDLVGLAGQESAAAHGLQRWKQGYDLREVTRELGKLNECVVVELDAYALADPAASQAVIADARRIWAALCSTGIEESVGQYFQLQQQEAAGHVADLEFALAEVRKVEQQRADLWRQAAHDLRGNLGVVANATIGLTHTGLRESTRDDFVRILMRNVTTLHHLLDDVTSLARLQAGQEQARIDPIDVSPIMQQLCEGIRPLAQQHRLFLRSDGPPGFAVDGDPVKLRRIAQNLILNAVKFTPDGGVTVSWGDGSANDPERWELRISDTGPGLHAGSGEPLIQALKSGSEQAAEPASGEAPMVPTVGKHGESGEGIGLSIVKRLCNLLNATIEIESVKDSGTTFRILFPRKYTN